MQYNAKATWTCGGRKGKQKHKVLPLTRASPTVLSPPRLPAISASKASPFNNDDDVIFVCYLNESQWTNLFYKHLNWLCTFSIILITALFTNMRILKFKSQLTIAFFADVNHLNGPLRKQNFTLTGSKVMVSDLRLVDFDPFCEFLCFKVRCLWS